MDEGMDETQERKFLDALAEASKLLELAQTQLQRARSQTSGDLYGRADLYSKRAFELKVRVDWLRYAVVGKIDFHDRQGSDRRVGIDRRIVGMQKRILSVA